MSNNSSNPKFITDSEQHRPIVKLQFNQENTNSQAQNHNSQEKNNGK